MSVLTPTSSTTPPPVQTAVPPVPTLGSNNNQNGNPGTPPNTPSFVPGTPNFEHIRLQQLYTLAIADRMRFFNPLWNTPRPIPPPPQVRHETRNYRKTRRYQITRSWYTQFFSFLILGHVLQRIRPPIFRSRSRRTQTSTIIHWLDCTSHPFQSWPKISLSWYLSIYPGQLCLLSSSWTRLAQFNSS